MSESLFEVLTRKIAEALLEGTVPWRRPWATNGPPRNLTSRRVYRGMNLFLLALEGYASPCWVTPAQLERLGGKVKEYHEPTAAIGWKWWQRKEKRWNDKTKIHEERTVWLPGWWYHELYNTDQCTGIDQHLPKMKNRKFTPLEACEKVVAGMPNPPRIEVGASQAYYLPLLDWVKMPNHALFTSDEGYYETLFHELAHSTGYDCRLGRHKQPKNDFDPDKHAYSKEELVAEMAAAMLCAHAGIDGAILENSEAYISHWLGCLGNDMKVFFYASLEGQKAADYILGKWSAKKREAGSVEPQ